MTEVAQNGYLLNISRYVSTAVSAVETDLQEVHENLVEIGKTAADVAARHNAFLAEPGLALI